MDDDVHDDLDHTDSLIDALHEASLNGGRLILPREITINGKRYARGPVNRWKTWHGRCG